ncbi:MAG: tetratricopeptide repeat protein [Desulfobacteraceae bacterium]|nr:tetratricopeptide repeat protein [Desulfobacteraceae bacterium]
MLKRVLFISSVLFGLVFFGVVRKCFADALAQLEQVETYKWYPSQAKAIYETILQDHPGTDYALKAQKNLVISYLSAKRNGQAQQTLDKLVEDFSGHSGLPEAFYDIARIYERSRKYDQAKSIYQQIIQQYPDSSFASKTQLAVPRMDVLSHIGSKNHNAAEAAIGSLITSFSGHSGLPSSLYDIARRYERAKKYEEAKGVYQQIIQQYPDSSTAGRARLAVPRINIFSLIESGNDSAAQAVNSLVTNFSGHSDLSEALYDIARRYESSKKYERAKNIYQQIINQFPDSSHAARAQLIVSKINIFSLIESGNYSSAQAAVDSLIADFSGHSYLPSVLYDIARRYEWSRKYEEAKSVYQQITQQYPESSYANKVQLGIPKCQILSYVDAREHSKALAAVDKLISDFRGDSRLPWAVSRIAKQYYTKAGQFESDGLADQAQDYFQKAIAIYEMVINESPGSTAAAEACYLAGNWYRKLGEYGKSTKYYERIVDDYSGYCMAWNALFLVGRNYENLERLGAISKSEANLKIKAAYERLLEKYPDCKAAKIARRWLSRHNSL